MNGIIQKGPDPDLLARKSIIIKDAYVDDFSLLLPPPPPPPPPPPSSFVFILIRFSLFFFFAPPLPAVGVTRVHPGSNSNFGAIPPPSFPPSTPPKWRLMIQASIQAGCPSHRLRSPAAVSADAPSSAPARVDEC